MNLQFQPFQESAQGVGASSFLQPAEWKGENKRDHFPCQEREGEGWRDALFNREFISMPRSDPGTQLSQS